MARCPGKVTRGARLDLPRTVQPGRRATRVRNPVPGSRSQGGLAWPRPFLRSSPPGPAPSVQPLARHPDPHDEGQLAPHPTRSHWPGSWTCWPPPFLRRPRPQVPSLCPQPLAQHPDPLAKPLPVKARPKCYVTTKSEANGLPERRFRELRDDDSTLPARVGRPGRRRAGENETGGRSKPLKGPRTIPAPVRERGSAAPAMEARRSPQRPLHRPRGLPTKAWPLEATVTPARLEQNSVAEPSPALSPLHLPAPFLYCPSPPAPFPTSCPAPDPGSVRPARAVHGAPGSWLRWCQRLGRDPMGGCCVRRGGVPLNTAMWVISSPPAADQWAWSSHTAQHTEGEIVQVQRFSYGVVYCFKTQRGSSVIA